ncbi:MAG: tRNA1(Val) (adenine(37)-N6)-methyltransferase [Desulfobacterales bacterium]
MKASTEDLFCGGRLRVRQPRCGYRFSIDAVVLAAFLRPRPGQRIADLGTGCGIIALLLASRCPKTNIVAVELQEDLVQLARENVSGNGFSPVIEVVAGDLRRMSRRELGGGFDWVVSNPPFRAPGKGRVCRDGGRAVARHEITLGLDDLLQAARRLLDPGGRLALVYDAGRTADLLCGMRGAGLEPKRLRFVHGSERHAARMVLAEARRGGRPGLLVEPPLRLFDAQGRYTPEVQACLEIDSAPRPHPPVDFDPRNR